MSFQAKSVLAEPSERKRYDLWLDSGIAMSFRHWQGLKDAVHTSMHWATPKLTGRMLSNGENQSAKDDELSEEEVLQHLRRLEEAGGEPLQREEEETNTKSHEKAAEGEDEDARAEDPEADEDDGNADEVAEDEISFPPTNFTELGLRVESPDPEWGWDRPEEELRAERLERYNAVREEDKGKDDGIPKINEVRCEGGWRLCNERFNIKPIFRASSVREVKQRRINCSDAHRCSLSQSHPPHRRRRRGRRRRGGSSSRRGKTHP